MKSEQHLGYFDFQGKCQKLVEIEDFVELGEYFHQPVKNLSLGMQMRAKFLFQLSALKYLSVMKFWCGRHLFEKLAKRMEQQCAEERRYYCLAFLPQFTGSVIDAYGSIMVKS